MYLNPYSVFMVFTEDNAPQQPTLRSESKGFLQTVLSREEESRSGFGPGENTDEAKEVTLSEAN